MREEPVDARWVALWIDSDGRLTMSQPEHGCDLDYERPDTVFACGQGSALVLTERYLHSKSFRLAHDQEVELAQLARIPNVPALDSFDQTT
jgi:hypothetical protein